MFALCPGTHAQLVSASPQRGAGTAEFIIAALPVLFLGLGSVELAHWFYTRQAISLALLEAGRAATTDHNRAEPIITAFEQALRPLFVSSSEDATTRRLQRALADRQKHINPPWKIEVLSPSSSAFLDFAQTDLYIAGTSGRPVINNDYLAEQDERFRASGWPEGRGPLSGQTIFEANTAVLQLSWLHKPHLPLMVPILKALGNPNGSYRQRALAKGYLPLSRQITLMMQSHPVQWTSLAGDKVVYGPESATSGTCTGWLCGTIWSEPDVASPTVPGLDDGRTPTPPPQTGAPSDGTPAQPGADAELDPDIWIDPDDPACGITLCCIP